LVVVKNAFSADAQLAWSLHQARRRRCRLEVLYAPGFEQTDYGRLVDQETVDLGRKELDTMLDHLGASSCTVLDVGGAEYSSFDAVRTSAMTGPYGLVMVGPIGTNTVLKLIFGSAQDGSDLQTELPLVVVPRSAWATALPASIPSTLTVGFDDSGLAASALEWAVAEANRRGGVVQAVMAWCEGSYGGLGGPVAVETGRASLVGRLAHHVADDLLAASGVPTNRVTPVARRGMPSAVLVKEAAGSDLLAVGAGRSVVHGHRTLGAVTLACLARSPVPVAIVPNRWAR
jgi:nucleotide-binding universal stress UspA family protein